jgi:hypothetical protein
MDLSTPVVASAVGRASRAWISPRYAFLPFSIRKRKPYDSAESLESHGHHLSVSGQSSPFVVKKHLQLWPETVRVLSAFGQNWSQK